MSIHQYLIFIIFTITTQPRSQGGAPVDSVSVIKSCKFLVVLAGAKEYLGSCVGMRMRCQFINIASAGTGGLSLAS